MRTDSVSWLLFFLFVSAIAAVFGFVVIGIVAVIAKTFFVIFAVLFLIIMFRHYSRHHWKRH